MNWWELLLGIIISIIFGVMWFVMRDYIKSKFAKQEESA